MRSLRETSTVMTGSQPLRPREYRTAWMGHGLATLLLATVFLLGITPIHDGDVWWHVKSGEDYVQHRSFPDHDPFLFTAGGHQFVIREWLAQVISYFVAHLGGLAGLTLFKAALFTLAVGIVWRLGAAPCRPVPAAAQVLLLLALVARPWLAERPEAFSFLLLAAALSVLLKGASGRPTDLLVPLQVLWANMQTSFLLRLLLPWPFLIDGAACRFRRGGQQAAGEQHHPLLHLAQATLLLLPAWSLTPEGMRALLYPLHLARFPSVVKIDE